jgi:hypothetical protein
VSSATSSKRHATSFSREQRSRRCPRSDAQQRHGGAAERAHIMQEFAAIVRGHEQKARLRLFF